MKYKVSYECKIKNDTFRSDFEIESESTPQKNDSVVTEAARKDSVKFAQIGLAAITINSITQLPKS